MILGLGRPSFRPRPSLLGLVSAASTSSAAAADSDSDIDGDGDACSALKQHQDPTPPRSFNFVFTNNNNNVNNAHDTASSNNNNNNNKTCSYSKDDEREELESEDSHSVDGSETESTSSSSTAPIETRSPPAMAPKDSKEEAGDEQKGVVFSISGPVIVAENMIGCAMYEMVGCSSEPPLPSGGLFTQKRIADYDDDNACSAMLESTKSLEKSSESQETRPLSRSTRRQVRSPQQLARLGCLELPTRLLTTD